MRESDFDDADRDAGVAVLPPEAFIPSRRMDDPSDIIELRSELVRKYHGGVSSLLERLQKDGDDDCEARLEALADEIVKESDNLLANGLVAINNGELRDASVISVKRAEVIEKVLKAITDKRKFEQSRGALDVESAAMMDVFRFFMKKSKDALDRMGVDSETNDLFFRTFSDVCSNWKSELKERLHETSGKS